MTESTVSDLQIDNEFEDDSGDLAMKNNNGVSVFEALKIMTDDYCERIMLFATKTPMSAIQLSNKLDIPIAACYRRIRLLKKAGILKSVRRVHTMKGKMVDLYVSVLKNSNIQFEGGQFRIKFELMSGAVKEFTERPNVGFFEQNLRM